MKNFIFILLSLIISISTVGFNKLQEEVVVEVYIIVEEPCIDLLVGIEGNIYTFTKVCSLNIKNIWGTKLAAIQQTTNWSWDSVGYRVKINWATQTCTSLKVGFSCKKGNNNFSTLPTGWSTTFKLAWSEYLLGPVGFEFDTKRIETRAYYTGGATCKFIS